MKPYPAKTVLKRRSQIVNVFSLAQAHLRHEWVLTFCLVAALAAVVAPLLILMGLKHGVVSTLRSRLIEDPAFREIRPAITREYSEQWLARYRQDSRIQFLVPSILPASSIIYVVPKGKGNNKHQRKLLDLNPTMAGDSLLLENHSPIPKEGECVLTHSAAAQLNVSVGDSIVAQVTRSLRGKAQVEKAPLRVVGVLPARANSVSAVYTTLAFVEDVEAYKEGRHVARRQWQGQMPYPHLSFDSAFVIVPKALNQLSANSLVINTGFHHVDSFEPQAFFQLSGLRVPAGWTIYQLRLASGKVTLSSIEAVKRKLRGKQAVVIPYAHDIVLQQGTQRYGVFGLSLRARLSEKLGWPTLAWGRLNRKQLQMARILQIVLPKGSAGNTDNTDNTGTGNSNATATGAASSAETPITRSFNLLNTPLTGLPLKVAAGDGNVALIPTELLGMLNTAKTRRVAYDKTSAALVMKKSGYRGFRAYSRSIDDVPSLVRDFRQQDNLEVIARVGEIERIQTLDKGLTKLFWLIAVLGVVGAGAVLIASLYAAVERERKNLGILRLLGMARLDVFWFPVFQGLIIAVISMLLSTLGYAALSTVINQRFGDDLLGDEAICQLPADYFVIALGAMVALSVISSFLAALKATHIETAEAIREE